MLHADRTERDGVLHIALSGVIDENADLTSIFVDLPRAVSLDLRGIRRINSVGVRAWVAMMAKLAAHDLIIEAVSYPLVIQAICVRSFFGKGRVDSCVAPYYCPSCSRPEEVVVRREEVTGGPADKRCSRCTAPMYFDELDQYFRVLYDS